MSEYVLATANPDKAREISEILGDGFRLLPRPPHLPEIDETGSTLVANARLKAAAIAGATGTAALADDTGLEVDALDGRPGVHSARYAGEHASYGDNVAKMLRELAEVPEPRTARFRTVAIAVFPDGTELVAEGLVEGQIATEPRGEGGFGYDPLFVPDDGEGRTFAEMTLDRKNRVSHRAAAFRALAALLEKRAEGC